MIIIQGMGRAGGEGKQSKKAHIIPRAAGNKSPLGRGGDEGRIGESAQEANTRPLSATEARGSTKVLAGAKLPLMALAVTCSMTFF